MWVARNKNGDLGLFTDKPFRYDDKVWCTKHGWYMRLDNDSYGDFDDLKWDNEPIEVELNRVNRHFTQCDKCGKAFSYLPRDVHSFTACLQPSSGYEDEFEYVICPNCKSEVYL